MEVVVLWVGFERSLASLDTYLLPLEAGLRKLSSFVQTLENEALQYFVRWGDNGMNMRLPSETPSGNNYH